MEQETYLPLDTLLEGSSGTAEQLDLPGISCIVLRTSPFKAQWQARLFEGTRLPTVVEPSEWNEDGNEAPISVTKSAAYKAYSTSHSTETESQSQEVEGVALNFATDVEYRLDNQAIGKPRNAQSKAEIERMLFEKLADGPKEIKVNVGQAIYGVTRNGVGKGITQHEGHKFTVAPLSLAEIELYVYGLEGRMGDYPPYLREIVETLKAHNQMDEKELDRLHRGMSLEELKQTVLSCRWPHVLLQSKIMAVNDIERTDERFENELGKLYWALLGAPQSASQLVSYFQVLSMSDSDTLDSSLYPEIGHWEQILQLEQRYFSFRRFTAEDSQAVSQMAHDNFANASTYQQLSEQERALYMQANTPEGVFETSTNPQNVAALVVKELTTGEDKVVGWRVLRRSNNPYFIEGKRMHVSRSTRGLGLGKRLLAISEGLGTDEGSQALIINASGASAEFFLHQGYRTLGVMENHDGVFEGDSLPKPDKTRLIKFL